MFALLSMIGAATVGLSIEDTRGISGAEARAIAEGLATALEARVGSVRLDDGPECPASPRCFSALRARTKAGPLVYVRLVGVPTRIRVMLALVPTGANAPSTNETLDLGRNRSSWPRAFERLANTLFPEATPAPPPPAVVEPPPPPPPKVSKSSPPPSITSPEPLPEDDSGSNVAPWILIGTGALALATGIGFGLSSQSARDDAATRVTTATELRDLEDRAIGHGVVANVAFGVSAVAVAGGIVWLLVD